MSRTFQHVKRKGDIYYLQSKADNSGQIKYSFARKLSGEPVVELPAGYEVREHPETAQVVIRRHKASQILAEEMNQLETSIRHLAKEIPFIVDLEDHSLTVYTADMDVDVRLMASRVLFQMDQQSTLRMQKWMLAHARYSKMLRFTLTDRKTRRFSLERWCFSGSIDDWIYIEGDATIKHQHRTTHMSAAMGKNCSKFALSVLNGISSSIPWRCAKHRECEWRISHAEIGSSRIYAG